MFTTNRRKRGFTTVELVIVIAVIAILAAVLIPTFAGIVDRAKLSADSVAVDQMNTVLKAEEILEGKPKIMNDVRIVLDEAGYNTQKNLTPVTKGHSFVWNSDDNRIMLVNEKNVVIYPEEYKNIELNKLAHINIAYPPAQVVETGAKSVNVSGQTDPMPLLCSFTYSATETSAEAYKSDYVNWRADFVISFNQDVTISSNKEFYLAGQYDRHYETWEYIPPYYLTTQINSLKYWSEGKLIEKDQSGVTGKKAYFDFTRFVVGEGDESAFSIKQGDEIELMPFVADHWLDGFTYDGICTIVQKFQCGVYASNEWIANYNTPLTMTVELRLYKPYYKEDGVTLAGFYDGRKVTEWKNDTMENATVVTKEKDYVTVHAYHYTFEANA